MTTLICINYASLNYQYKQLHLTRRYVLHIQICIQNSLQDRVLYQIWAQIYVSLYQKLIPVCLRYNINVSTILLRQSIFLIFCKLLNKDSTKLKEITYILYSSKRLKEKSCVLLHKIHLVLIELLLSTVSTTKETIE